jgi:3-phenylpropionate/cinnamic acid dioxygenase small subunit
MSTSPTETELARFVLDEARLLNEARYADWLALFADDGRYWVPLDGERQPDATAHASIACEDRMLLAIRMRRMDSGRAHSMAPGVRSLHVVQPAQVTAMDPAASTYRTAAPFIYAEAKGDRTLQLAGTWRHTLRATAEGLRIVEKRVDLLNARAAHEAIHLFP